VKDLLSAEGARAWQVAMRDLARAEFKRGPGGSKDRLAIYLRRMARRTDAVGFAFMSEVWELDEDKRKKLVSDPTMSWETVAGRREALMVVTQHKALGEESFHASALITRPKRGKPTVGPWHVDGAAGSGRFAGVLRTAKEERVFAPQWAGFLEAAEYLDPEARRLSIENVREEMYRKAEVPRAEVDASINRLVQMMSEAGRPVAARAEDKAADTPLVTVVDLAEVPLTAPGEKPQ
jgi:hypothetical protein